MAKRRWPGPSWQDRPPPRDIRKLRMYLRNRLRQYIRALEESVPHLEPRYQFQAIRLMLTIEYKLRPHRSVQIYRYEYCGSCRRTRHQIDQLRRNERLSSACRAATG